MLGPLVPLFAPPVIAVDLPGRGLHPADLRSVTFETCAESVRDDVDAAGFDEISARGSLARRLLHAAMIELLGRRVRHAVFIVCTVPEHGASAFDTLDPEIQELAHAAGPDVEPRRMSDELAKVVLGDDLDDEQMAFFLECLVPEAPRLSNDPVDLVPLHGKVPATWIRTMRDIIVAPEKQIRFAKNVGPDCTVVDLDAGHMCMVSQPAATAAILNSIAVSHRGRAVGRRHDHLHTARDRRLVRTIRRDATIGPNRSGLVAVSNHLVAVVEEHAAGTLGRRRTDPSTLTFVLVVNLTVNRLTAISWIPGRTSRQQAQLRGTARNTTER